MVGGQVNWFIPEKTAKLSLFYRGGAWTAMRVDDRRQFSKPILTSLGTNAQSNSSGRSINLVECNTTQGTVPKFMTPRWTRFFPLWGAIARRFRFSIKRT